MIKSFSDAATADLHHGVSSARVRNIPQDVKDRAFRKLDMLNAATNIADLTVPPSNNLEKLAGDLKGFHSIRVNKQYRIIFKWDGSNATDVKFCDYH